MISLCTDAYVRVCLCVCSHGFFVPVASFCCVPDLLFSDAFLQVNVTISSGPYDVIATVSRSRLSYWATSKSVLRIVARLHQDSGQIVGIAILS